MESTKATNVTIKLTEEEGTILKLYLVNQAMKTVKGSPTFTSKPRPRINRLLLKLFKAYEAQSILRGKEHP